MWKCQCLTHAQYLLLLPNVNVTDCDFDVTDGDYAFDSDSYWQWLHLWRWFWQWFLQWLTVIAYVMVNSECEIVIACVKNCSLVFLMSQMLWVGVVISRHCVVMILSTVAAGTVPSSSTSNWTVCMSVCSVFMFMLVTQQSQWLSV